MDFELIRLDPTIYIHFNKNVQKMDTFKSVHTSKKNCYLEIQDLIQPLFMYYANVGICWFKKQVLGRLDIYSFPGRNG